MWPDNQLRDLFSINLPIIQAPMAGSSRMLSDKFEPVSVYRETREPMRNKAAATQKVQRFGSF